MEIKKNLPQYKDIYNTKPKNEQYSNPDGLISDSTTTTTVNTINSNNNYICSNYKMPKTNILSISQKKNNPQISPNNQTIPNINVYSKWKLKKTLGNITNNIIINNNTNIINNNNTNIVNNNIINYNIDDEKEYSHSMIHVNISKIKSFKNKYINNNSIKGKNLIFNIGKICP